MNLYGVLGAMVAISVGWVLGQVSTNGRGTKMRLRTAVIVAALAGLVSSGLAGCGGEERKYEPKPAHSGKKASLPAVPTLPQKNKKDGDAYTVWGVTHDLRSRVHNASVDGKRITIVGYIVKVNYDDAPECAIHKVGKGDEPDCKAPVPSFSIADSKDEKEDMIDVMGWASNFAQLFSLIEEIEKAPKGEELDLEVMDGFFAQKLPVPIPNVGAKVKVTGTYGTTFTKVTGGAAANPKYGIMNAEIIEYLEMPTEAVNLKTMKPLKKSIADYGSKGKK